MWSPSNVPIRPHPVASPSNAPSGPSGPLRSVKRGAPVYLVGSLEFPRCSRYLSRPSAPPTITSGSPSRSRSATAGDDHPFPVMNGSSSPSQSTEPLKATTAHLLTPKRGRVAVPSFRTKSNRPSAPPRSRSTKPSPSKSANAGAELPLTETLPTGKACELWGSTHSTPAASPVLQVAVTRLPSEFPITSARSALGPTRATAGVT